MDDSCAVCADTLEWVAYGPCGHREVCSTCIIRLRFICDDCRCCLCKSEWKTIFITKAMGDYTKVINDLSAFAADPIEGQVGPYWYHEGTQAYIDDLDHYKMIKAMCRLSCTVCDKKDEQWNGGSKRRAELKNMEQLKSHLLNRHRLLMCSLCLEGRKVFMCEQKLYTRAQLAQHIETGDSEVDGSESERGGFMGHPMCEFCQNPFYGENELYLHMSTEHYTCHICQRRHPGQYEYYRNYDDMEIHFRQEHHLCEDEACLAKKFIVFASESELKRHNAVEHGGRMSRSKRNAALQIPISFQYRRSYEQDHRVRRHGSQSDLFDSQLSLAMQASLATANAESFHYTSTSGEVVVNNQETNGIASIVGPFEALATLDSEPSSRCCQALGNSRNGPLDDSSFPPLTAASNSSQQKLRNGSEGSARSSMAACLRRRNNGTLTVPNTAQAWPAASLQPKMSATGSHQSRPAINFSRLSRNSSSSSKSKHSRIKESLPSGHVSSAQGTFLGLTANFSSLSRSSVGTRKVSHSAAEPPNIVDRGFFVNSLSNFPSVSSANAPKNAPTSSQPSPKVEDAQSANKALVEKIRASFEFDKDKYSAFKGITAEYRQGIINAEEYLAYVHQFGLSHLVLEIAGLCPNVQKQRELEEAYNFNMRRSRSHKTGPSNDGGQSKNIKTSKKGKEKCGEVGISGLKHALANGAYDGAKVLLLNQKPYVEEAEVLRNDGRHAAKGKFKVFADEEANSHFPSYSQTQLGSNNGSQPAGGSSNKNLPSGGGGNKPGKKASKFLRNRLGDASAAQRPDVGDSDPGPDQIEEKADENREPPEGLPVCGVWRNGGGRRLMAMNQGK
ncbi:E3 ubiquitin-protein ligase HEL2-like [Herrania umbratica]|uniref:E3 ubiquitin-protein ligase HEL2-like n=1 Tax=Herrania umbratica TaxID=108875 RepID=A0A6J1A4L5_9ROSI|nr:E3 ubiquitin-protein ligase HEL2-like [Herrania umbratica]XP_021281640.1 E3 ubiquitin-protein ligase HEL2-like [Herrania umbratica]XP_021281641.1 E3 ubiquitin-protein ligase HEL2-like [Herrania umbratica]